MSTEYVVLQQRNTAWCEVDPGTYINATSATAAIRQAVTTVSSSDPPGASNGAYVAIPLRSFKPVKVVVETKPTVQIGEAL